MQQTTLTGKLKKLSDNLADKAYDLSFKFPKVEQYALADQIRRSVLSVPSNLYEGLARESVAEKKRFVNIAYSSLAEFKYQIYFARKRKYISQEQYAEIKALTEELSKLLYALTKKL